MNYLIAIIALTSPVWMIYLCVMFMRWKEYQEEKKKPLHRCLECGNWYKEQIDHNCSGGAGGNRTHVSDPSR